MHAQSFIFSLNSRKFGMTSSLTGHSSIGFCVKAQTSFCFKFRDTFSRFWEDDMTAGANERIPQNDNDRGRPQC